MLKCHDFVAPYEIPQLLKPLLHDCPDFGYGRIGTIKYVIRFPGVIDQVKQLLVFIVWPEHVFKILAY